MLKMEFSWKFQMCCGDHLILLKIIIMLHFLEWCNVHKRRNNSHSPWMYFLITHFRKWELSILLYNSWCKIVGLELVECFLQYVEKKGKKLPMHKKIPTTISDHLKKIKEIIHSPNIDMH
jgi:hypothetical protein